DSKLLAIVRGAAKPANAAERIEFATLCSIRKFPGTAARFYQEAFAAQPALAEDLDAGHRFDAARAAALAGAGPGKGDPPLDDPPLDKTARVRWCQQALSWLRAELDLRTKQLSSGKPEGRLATRQALALWLRDADLASLREEAALAKLTETEQKACRQLWLMV